MNAPARRVHHTQPARKEMDHRWALDHTGPVDNITNEPPLHMNIGILYGMTTYPPSSGGTVHGYQLIKELTKRGHKVMSCYFDHGENPDLKTFRFREILEFLRVIDVLYIRVEWQTSATMYSLLKFATAKRVPVIWEFNGTPNELRYASNADVDIKYINRKLKRWRGLCDAAVCVTGDIAKYVREELGIATTSIIPNGSDPELFHVGEKSLTPSDKFRVVWVGTSSAGWHDLPTLIKAAQEVFRIDRTVSFEVYGDPASLTHNLPDNVRPMGIVKYDRLGDYLAGAHVGVHLFKKDKDGSLPAGSPLKLFDYMAAGLAVVTNCAGQQSNIIRTWSSGVQSGSNVDDLVECITQLSKNRARCIQMGQRGRQAIVDQYNWPNVAQMTESVIQQAVQRK